jgi:DNA segregation ATPase FtsK/SpoIIIE-like protein
MARALGMVAGAKTSIVTPLNGALLIEIPKPEPMRRVLMGRRLEDKLKPPHSLAVPLGIRVNEIGAAPLWLDLRDETQAHILIGGITQGGKSMLLKWLLYRLFMQNKPDALGFIAADPKVGNRGGLLPFTHSGHLLHPIQRDVFEVVRLLTWVMVEISRREITGETTPRLLVVVEEVKHYTDESSDVAPLLARIIQVAAAWGIHVIATTQAPKQKTVGEALSNFPVSIFGRVARETEAWGATGRAKTGVASLLQRGDMVYLAAGETVHFQAPYIENKHIWSRIPKGGPGSLDALLPRADRIAVGLKGESRGRKQVDFSEGEMAAAGQILATGGGVDAVRRALGMGTTRAKRLCEYVREG